MGTAKGGEKLPKARSTRRETDEKLELLISMVNTDFAGKCAHWLCNKTKKNYGVLQFQKRLILAHRLSYCLANKVSVESIHGLVIRRKCDNPICINPAHLEIGTQADNVADMHARRRNGHGGAKGESNAGAKLSETQVLTIRKMIEDKERLIDIAKKFGVSRYAIYRINNGTHWRHI